MLMRLLTVRRNQSKDIEPILDLLRRCFPDREFPHLTIGCDWYAALLGPELVGTCQTYVNEIKWVVVDPAYRRKGIAHSLLSWLLQNQNGPWRVRLNPPTEAAVKLYEKLGFIECPS